MDSRDSSEPAHPLRRDVESAMQQTIAAVGQDVVLKLMLAQFGVDEVGRLKKDDRADFIKAMKDLLSSPAATTPAPEPAARPSLSPTATTQESLPDVAHGTSELKVQSASDAEQEHQRQLQAPQPAVPPVVEEQTPQVSGPVAIENSVASSVPRLISLGAGKASTTATPTLVPTAVEMVELLRQHGGPEAWWTVCKFRNDQRNRANCESTCAVVLDLDYVQPKRDPGQPKDVPPEDAHKKLDGVALRSGCTIYHRTPHGGRLVWLLTEQCSELSMWRRATQALGERVGDSLAGSGFKVDPASHKPEQFWFAPNAVVKGVVRQAEVKLLGAEVAIEALLSNESESRAGDRRVDDHRDLGADPERDLLQQRAQELSERVRDRNGPFASLEEAAEAYRQRHPIQEEFFNGDLKDPMFAPKTELSCPICRHHGCVSLNLDAKDRAFCFSTNHEKDGKGVGRKGASGYFFDVVDVHAHKAGQSHEQFLCEQGLLDKPPALHFEDLDEGQVSPQAQAQARPWKRHLLQEVLSTKPNPWIVQGYVRAGQLGFVVAFPTVGKSTLLAAWAISVLYGTQWCGKRVKAGSVVCLVGEGRRGFCNRLDAFRRHHGLGPWPGDRYVEIVDFKLPLSSSKGQAEVRRLIDEVKDDRGHAPTLVIVDTLSSHWAESEDSAEFGAPAMRALGDVAHAFNCVVAVAHHTTKANGKNTMPELGDLRGSGAFIGNTDFVFGMCASSRGAELAGLKLKDDERPPRLELKLEAVPCGCDEDDQPISAGVFSNTAAPVGDASSEKARAETAFEDVVKSIVEAMINLKTATRVDTVVTHAHVGLQKGRAAFDVALSRGWIKVTKGKGRLRTFEPTQEGRQAVAFRLPTDPLEGEPQPG